MSRFKVSQDYNIVLKSDNYILSYNIFFYFSLRISTSIYPVPSIADVDSITDWFDSLAGCLHWNVRKQQKPFHHIPSNGSIDSTSSSDNGNANGVS